MNSFKHIILAIGLSAAILSDSYAELLEDIDGQPSQTPAREVIQGYTILQQSKDVIWIKRVQHVAALGNIAFIACNTSLERSGDIGREAFNMLKIFGLYIYLSFLSLPSLHGLYKSLTNAPQVIPEKYDLETLNTSSKYLVDRILKWSGKGLFALGHGVILIFHMLQPRARDTNSQFWQRYNRAIISAVLSMTAIGLNIAAEMMPPKQAIY